MDYIYFRKHKSITIFLVFLLLAVVMSVVEDIFAVLVVTQSIITLKIILIIIAISVPFAVIGELIVDRIDIPIIGRKTEIFLEFLVFGIIVGVIEDIIAIYFSTGVAITLETFKIVILIAVPFAVLSELIVDRIDVFQEKNK